LSRLPRLAGGTQLLPEQLGDVGPAARGRFGLIWQNVNMTKKWLTAAWNWRIAFCVFPGSPRAVPIFGVEIQKGPENRACGAMSLVFVGLNFGSAVFLGSTRSFNFLQLRRKIIIKIKDLDMYTAATSAPRSL